MTKLTIETDKIARIIRMLETRSIRNGARSNAFEYIKKEQLISDLIFYFNQEEQTPKNSDTRKSSDYFRPSDFKKKCDDCFSGKVGSGSSDHDSSSQIAELAPDKSEVKP